MAKKMHDILPPKAKSKKKPAVAKTLAPDIEKKKAAYQNIEAEALNILKENPSEAPKMPPTPAPPKPKILPARPEAPYEPAIPKKARKLPVKIFFAVLAIIIVAAGVVAFFQLQKADIEIWPSLDTLTLSQQITADKSVSATDPSTQTIPARYIDIQKSGQQQFPATGMLTNSGSATGVITVYNSISPSTPFSLVAGTHFLSDSGMYFVSTQKVTVPAGKKGTPGSVSVNVKAEAIGASYNIGPSKFSLPKLSGSAYYYNIYGASTAAMNGGYQGNVKDVTDDDIQGANDVLTKQLLSQAEESLTSQVGADEVLLNGASVSNIISATASVASGAIADNFTEQAAVDISALVFKKADVENLVKTAIAAQLPSNKTYLENSVNINYTPGAIDIQGGKEAMTAQVSASIYQNINTNSLVAAFAGKSADQIKQVLNQMYAGEISQLKINFWPFWVTSAPNDTSRIKVNLDF